MPEIRFKISEKLDKNLSEICDRLGIDRADYIKMLIVNDLRKEEELHIEDRLPDKDRMPDKTTKTIPKAGIDSVTKSNVKGARELKKR